MSSAILPFGTESASSVPLPSHNEQAKPVSAPPVAKTLGDLLIILRDQPPEYFGFLKTTCGHLSTYLNQPADQLSFETIAARKPGFRGFLKGRGYAENSVKQYMYQTHVLLKLAQKHGWDPTTRLSAAWKAALARSADAEVKAIAHYFSSITDNPSEITIADLDSWEKLKISEGVYFPSARRTRNKFVRFLKEGGWATLKPPGMQQRENYGIPIDQLAPELRDEMQILLNWKQAKYAKNRPTGGRIRKVSADKLRGTLGQLAGYVINILGANPRSFEEMISQEFVEGFVEWMVNERDVKGHSFRASMGMLLAILKYHPKYRPMNFDWFKPMLEGIPLEAESQRKRRKAEKYIDYEVLEAIPAKIRAERNAVERKKKSSGQKAASLAAEELIMLWLTMLPWRQRNVRELRISGLRPNLFKAKIPSLSEIDKPAWVVEEEEANPTAEFWQIQFTPEETKTGLSIHILLPRPLIGLLEEYLTKYRPLLLSDVDPETLFINRHGRPLNSKLMQRVVGQWALRYAGVRTTPHLFRDAVAFKWLKEHPADYLTLSKMLWHKSIETTIHIYGSQYNESSGVRAMEEWTETRNRKLQ